MAFLRKLFKTKEPMPASCPNLETLSGEFWCDMGQQRVKIAHLAFSYADVRSDHVERICKGKYASCPIYQASRFSR